MSVPCDVAFDALTPAACYFAGLLATDGCIGGAEPARVSIKLLASDVAIIEAFRTFLHTDAAISYHPRRDRSRPQAGIQVRSVPLVRRLTELGIGPRKSLSLNITSQELLRSHDFWRGAIDGDGTVAVFKNGTRSGRVYWYPRIQLVSGSETFILQFSDYLREHDVRATLRVEQTRAVGKEHWIYTCVVSNQTDVVRLARLLYDRCGEHALKRKRSVAERILTLYRETPNRKPIITAQMRSNIIDSYERGTAATRVASAFGLTTTAVTNVLKSAGVTLRSKSGNHSVKQYSARSVILTYKRLRSTRQTAKSLGVSRDTVRKVLKAHGILT